MAFTKIEQTVAMNLKKIAVAFFFAISYDLSFGNEMVSPQSTDIDSAKYIMT